MCCALLLTAHIPRKQISGKAPNFPLPAPFPLTLPYSLQTVTSTDCHVNFPYGSHLPEISCAGNEELNEELGQ